MIKSVKYGKRILTALLTILFFVQFVFATEAPKQFLNGKVETIQSEILDESRTIFVYLPDNYVNSKKSYPVHYITDAPATSNIFYDLLRLQTKNDLMPESIIVGLSSNNREQNLHIEKSAKKYLKFLNKEVIPHIDENYRTKDFKSINGHSLGGGFALYAFFKKLNVFNMCIAGSPYPINSLVKIIDGSRINKKSTGIRYLYSSIGTKNDIQSSDFKNLKNTVEKNNFHALEYDFKINSHENHISNIAINFQDGLENFYAGWKFLLPDTLEQPLDVLLKKHYKKLSTRVGYDVEISEWGVIFPLMDRLAKRGDFKNAINILKYDIQLHPQSDQAYAFLARAYISIGDMHSAKKNLKMALELNPKNKFALQIKQMINK